MFLISENSPHCKEGEKKREKERETKSREILCDPARHLKDRILQDEGQMKLDQT
jgi:hypothetical protein